MSSAREAGQADGRIQNGAPGGGERLEAATAGACASRAGRSDLRRGDECRLRAARPSCRRSGTPDDARRLRRPVGAVARLPVHRRAPAEPLVACRLGDGVAASTAAGFAFRQASGSELSVMDVLSLWSARHEAGRAMDFYASRGRPACSSVLALGLFVFASPPVPARSSLAPLADPLGLGAGHSGDLHVRRSSSIRMAAARRRCRCNSRRFQSPASRRPPLLTAPVRARPSPGSRRTRRVRQVVVLVDESIRGDYIDWTPGQPVHARTGRPARSVRRSGPAASGGIAATIRMRCCASSRPRTTSGAGILPNPTIWSTPARPGSAPSSSTRRRPSTGTPASCRTS